MLNLQPIFWMPSPKEKVEPILAGLKPVFDRYTGVMSVSDVAVSRGEYFTGGEEKK